MRRCKESVWQRALEGDCGGRVALSDDRLTAPALLTLAFLKRVDFESGILLFLFYGARVYPFLPSEASDEKRGNISMTAEIAVLNKHGVALAADSAITIRKPSTQKVFNSANKLFMLSKHHPVGVMVYGAASLMGIPWETIIKIYREDLHTANCDKLAGFADHFFAYLNQNRALFPADLQAQELVAMCHWVLAGIRKDIDEEVKTLFDKNGSVSDAEVLSCATSVIDRRHGEWHSLARLDVFPEPFESEFRAKYAEIQAVRDKLIDICSCRVTREWWSVSAGGIVFAGFGKDDIFPAVRAYTVEFVVNDVLKRELLPGLSFDVNQDGASAIMPYAQPDMVYRFIRGVDPEYSREIFRTLNTTAADYASQVIEAIRGRITDEQCTGLEAILREVGNKQPENLGKSISGWERTKFIDPVVDVVGDLPKDELAAMAESLVNLTSFKLKITAEAETVGGPIDVAVISKGDGFIWIKRKHYFGKDLNPSFFANYYKRRE